MAEIPSDGTASFGGLSDSVNAVVRWMRTEPRAPEDTTIYPSTLAQVSFVRESWNGLSGDVQLQVSSTNDFTNLVFDQTITGVSGDGVTARTVNIPGLTNLSTYWWRTRPVYDGSLQPSWDDAEVWTFDVNIYTGNVMEYSEVNVGVEITPDDRAFHYSDINIGVIITLSSESWEYSDVNVGINVTVNSYGHDYLHYGDVSTNRPIPHIWVLRPSAGRPFDGIDIIGLGFGDLQEEYNGLPQIRIEAVWEALSVVDWQAYGVSPDAYTVDRLIDLFVYEIDPVHQIISVIIPAEAVPNGHLVRVRTEDT